MNRAQRIARFNLMVVAVGGGTSLLTIVLSLAVGSVALTYFGFLLLGVAGLVASLLQFWSCTTGSWMEVNHE